MCENHVNDAIRKAFDVKKVTSSHSKKQAEIITEEDLTEDKVRAVLAEGGYDVLGMTREEKKRGLFGW